MYVDGGFLHLQGVSFEENGAEAHQVPVAARMSFSPSPLFRAASTARARVELVARKALHVSPPLYCM